jgi:hypothetical protein
LAGGVGCVEKALACSAQTMMMRDLHQRPFDIVCTAVAARSSPDARPEHHIAIRQDEMSVHTGECARSRDERADRRTASRPKKETSSRCDSFQKTQHRQDTSTTVEREKKPR